MSKEDFQAAKVPLEYAELYFKSGGSSGDPKLSVFTYADYHKQMGAAADGLFAAGLNPRHDRCMNLFFGGGLYGGFVSFFTILESLNAVQFPMAGHADMRMVGETIVAQKCNVLLGMPSYIIQLFAQNAELFSKNKIVEKIFYGGEHFNESQKRYFQSVYGVKIIRSGGYGSVDAGPIGYQCSFCTGAVHHLHSRLHVLEILDLENDAPVPTGTPGRVVLSSLSRAGQHIERYDIGDLARILPGHCPCARKGPLFELLGRHGDVFRIGSAYFNYGKFAQIFTEHFDYSGELQIILRAGNGIAKEQLLLAVSKSALPEATQILTGILDNYADLHEIVQEGLLDVQVEFVDGSELERTAGSGKLRRIVDERALSRKS
jgi:phenylacetate-coenzyme A ligase PaaK-like adenylate-forming protein